MSTRIVFGSQEANAILMRDRELQRLELLEDEEEPKGDSNELAVRLEMIEFEIEELESEIAGLEDEAERIRTKLREMPKAEPKAGWSALNKWNAWATGTLVTQ